MIKYSNRAVISHHDSLYVASIKDLTPRNFVILKFEFLIQGYLLSNKQKLFWNNRLTHIDKSAHIHVCTNETYVCIKMCRIIIQQANPF